MQRCELLHLSRLFNLLTSGGGGPRFHTPSFPSLPWASGGDAGQQAAHTYPGGQKDTTVTLRVSSKAAATQKGAEQPTTQATSTLVSRITFSTGDGQAHLCVLCRSQAGKGRVKGQYLALGMPGPDGGVWKFGQEHPGSQKVAPK